MEGLETGQGKRESPLRNGLFLWFDGRYLIVALCS